MEFDKKKIKNKFIKFSPKEYWGDDLDVRFYLVSLIKKKQFAVLLDISSNCGIILNECNSRLRIGLDYSWGFLIKSKKYFSALTNIQASSEFLPFRNNSINAIVLAHSLPGWDFPLDTYVNKNGEIARKKLFNDIHRILKPRGKLYITTVNGRHIYYRDKEKANLDKIISYLDGLFYVEQVIGWNPLPVLANIIPYIFFERAPAYIKRLMLLPAAKMYLFIPGIWQILLALSRIKALNKYCRHLLLVCYKK
ncbi:MAG: methyltransferase domain-containing protein [Candidatus Omnitrophica bacterium]|nr:methyltransferase domain-containing protein [Candidatus Omnitrophota bacterium]